jgi:hypothetical protein
MLEHKNSLRFIFSQATYIKQGFNFTKCEYFKRNAYLFASTDKNNTIGHLFFVSVILISQFLSIIFKSSSNNFQCALAYKTIILSRQIQGIHFFA